MESKSQHEAVEQGLNEQLAKDGLSRISKSIASLQKAGFQVIDWSQFGRPPFEKFVVEAHLPIEKAASLQPLVGDKNFKEILILRRGIPPMQNFYNLKFTIENA